MTTSAFSTVINHTNSAGFRAWSTEFYNALIAVGLTQTADTGQLATPVVAAVPGVINTAAGYWIFRFNDSIQATSPVFIKIEVGTAGGLAVPGIWITVGTSTNGAGTITGTTIVARQLSAVNTSISSAVTAYPSYFCYIGGYLGIAFKSGSTVSTSSLSFITIGRSVDDNGAFTADGLVVNTQSNSAQFTDRSFNYGTATVYSSATSNAWCLVHYGSTNTAVGADFQVFKHYGFFPRVRSLLHKVTVVAAEVPDFTTFSVAAVGVTPHTYINVGPCSTGAAGLGSSGSSHRVAMIFE